MKKKISIDQLTPGMYVTSTNRGWLQLPFFRRRIKDQRAIQKLVGYHVTEVVIDTEKGIDLPAESESQRPDPFDHPEILHENLARSSRLHGKVIEETQAMMALAERGEPIDPALIDQPVNELIDQIMDDPQSLLCVSVLKNTDEYTFNHCVNVSILSLFLAKSVGLGRDKMLELGKGALLHDIGKCMIPSEIIVKPGRLDEDEAEVVKTHVERGLRYLTKVSGISKGVLDFVRDHHERIDGSGYPRGLKGDEITWYGRVGAVLDVYDALIHKNYYKGSMDPISVLSQMRASVGSLYDAKAFESLAECLGEHPPGTILMLDTGEISIVFEPNYTDAARPRVLLMTQQDGSFHEHPVAVDLTETEDGGDGYTRSVLATMTLEEIPFDPFQILGSFSLQGTDIG